MEKTDKESVKEEVGGEGIRMKMEGMGRSIKRRMNE